MKKIVLIIAFTVSLFGHSQSNSRFGVKAGINLATFTGDVNEAQRALNFHTGMVFESPMGNHLSFQPEFLYAIQGTKFSNKGSMGVIALSGGTTYKLGYFSVPLPLKLYLSDNFSIHFGPQVAYLLSAKKTTTSSVENGNTSSSNSRTIDVIHNYRRLDYGVSFGAGFRFNNGVTLGGRYHIGVGNVLKDSNKIITNNVIQISVGFLM